MKYIHRIDFQDPQSFDVAVASTIDEVKHLAGAGFQKFDEVNRLQATEEIRKLNKCNP